MHEKSIQPPQSLQIQEQPQNNQALLLIRTFAVLKHQRAILEESAKQAILRAELAAKNNPTAELVGIANGLRQGLEDALLISKNDKG